MDTVVIKEYGSALEANMDKALLEDNGIEAEVLGELSSGVNIGVPLPLFGSVRLIVMENNEAKAKELLGIE